MIMKNASTIFQIILQSILIFLLIFIWVRYYVSPLWLTFVISILSTITIELLYRLFVNKKVKTKQLKNKEKAHAENIFISICTNKQKYLDFLYKTLSTKDKCEKTDNYIIIINHDVKRAIFPINKLRKINCDDILKVIQDTKSEKLDEVVILCNNIEKECIAFANKFSLKISFFNKYETYKNIYKEFNSFPEEELILKKTKKNTFKELLSYAFSYDKAKGYGLTALILLISSIFVSFNLYYSIMVTILVLFTFISLSNKKEA